MRTWRWRVHDPWPQVRRPTADRDRAAGFLGLRADRDTLRIFIPADFKSAYFRIYNLRRRGQLIRGWVPGILGSTKATARITVEDLVLETA
jgi:hypothetical protein